MHNFITEECYKQGSGATTFRGLSVRNLIINVSSLS